MLTISLSSQKLFECVAQAYVYFVTLDTVPQVIAQLTPVFANIAALIEQQKFTGKAGDLLVIPVTQKNELRYLVLVGLGKPSASPAFVETYRRALGAVVRAAEARKLSTIALTLPPVDQAASSVHDLLECTATALRMAAYFFDVYITDKDRLLPPLAVTIAQVAADDAAQKSLERGLLIGQAVNQARYWIDMPPCALTPTELADRANDIAIETGLKITTFSEAEINTMGMGGLAAVSKGSHQDCKLVVLEYKGKKDAPTIALVGKGITFDSGGLSLKPANYMETMKEDMSGAAAVISALGVIARLKPAINVIGLTPLAENLPSGEPTMPGDIVRFYNGKTAEIKNTDAEGRLILADALAYAVKQYKLDAIIDIATLTGACSVALGPFFTGLLGVHDELIKRIESSAQRTGDAVWRLPLTDDYKKAIKSPVADLSNTGTPAYSAGTITAACFLQNFVGDVPWAHLDIASTAFDVPDISYYRPGATGAGVRLLIDVVMNWSK